MAVMPEADASSLPSGEKAMGLKKFVCTSNLCSSVPEHASQTLMIPSREEDANNLLSGERTTLSMFPLCPLSVQSKQYSSRIPGSPVLSLVLLFALWLSAIRCSGNCEKVELRGCG